MDDREIDRMLAELGQEDVPLPSALRAAIVAEAETVARPTPTSPGLMGWLSGWGGAMGVPVAALAGLWMGIAQPALVLQAVPGLDSGVVAADQTLETEDPILSEVFGDNWESVEQ